MTEKKSNKFALRTLLSGFILHIILGTIYLRKTITRYFYSYLIELNYVKFKISYLEFLFGLAMVFHSIFIPFGILLNVNKSSIKIIGFYLLTKIFSIIIYIHIPNIIVITLILLINSVGSGLAYFPIILEIWKYFPNNKGLCTSYVLSGFGLSRLFYKYISVKIINPKKIDIDLSTSTYPPEISINFKNYLKIMEIFFSILSFICIFFIYPYDKYNSINLKRKHKKQLYKNEARSQTNLNLEDNRNINNKNNKHKETEFYSAQSLRLKKRREGNGKIRYENDIINSSGYLLNLTKNFFTEKNTSDKKHYKEDDLEHFSIVSNEAFENVDSNLNEPLISSLLSRPYLQLTYIFFFTFIFNSIETSSIKKFGLFNGFSEHFLWYTSLLWKITGFIFYPIWGYLLDKMKFKKLYTIILILEILVCASCYFILGDSLSFLLYSTVNSAVSIANISLSPTIYSFIFDNEKGSLLFGISIMLFNSFFIYKPVINSFFGKNYYFLFYPLNLFFNMIALIILCFFEEEKYEYFENSENSGSIIEVDDNEENLEELQNIEPLDSEGEESKSDLSFYNKK